MTSSHASFSGTASLPTEELSGLRLILRSDLAFTLQKYAGEVCYVVEDPVRAAFYRIGTVEYSFLSLLNGRNTVSEAIAKASVALGTDAITEAEASTICRWLTENHLASTSDSLHGQRFSELQNRSEQGQWRKWSNPLSLSVNLGNPTPLLQRLLPFTSWLYRSTGWIIWVTILSFAAFRLLMDDTSILRDSSPVIAPENWMWLAIVWLALKIVHECSHGLCCLRYGGKVRTFGLNFIMFAPLPFVDASSSWQLPSKWQRIHVAFAGIFAELLLAAIAAIIRSYSDNDVLRMLCLNIMLTGGVLTLLFNLNPLSRFDGYYILCDWLEQPNLSQTAQRCLIQLIKRIGFGVRQQVLISTGPWVLMITYGTLAAIWRMTITVSMLIAAESLFHGAGLPLAIIAAVFWVALPLWNAARYLILGNLQERPSRSRFAAIVMGIFALSGWLGQTLMWPEILVLPAVVDFDPIETARCRVSGFVTKVCVEAGQHVSAGDVLIILSNPQLEFELAELEVEVARSRLRRQYFQSLEDIASRQTEDATLSSLELKLAEKQKLVEQLQVSSPTAGVVIASDLENLTGQFLSAGDSFCLVGNTAEKQIRVMISQDDVEAVLSHEGQPVEIRFRGTGDNSTLGTLTMIDPRATVELIHPALASVAGGPLAVRIASTSGDMGNSNGTAADSQHWRLPAPCFTGRIEIPEPLRSQCGAGQLASVHLTMNHATVGSRLWKGARRLLDARLSERSKEVY